MARNTNNITWYLNLPSYYSSESDPQFKFRRRRITGDENDWSMRFAVAEAATKVRWHDKERPFAYVAESARNVMRGRIRKDEREHIDSGGRLMSFNDLEDEIVDLPAEALVPLKTDTLPFVEDIHSLLNDIELDPDVLNVCHLLAKGTKWKNIATQLSWTTQRVEAARAKFARARPRIREAIAQRASWQATTSGPVAAGPAYVERFYSGVRVWTQPPINSAKS